MLDRYVDVRLEKALNAPFNDFDKEEPLIAAPLFAIQKASSLVPLGYRDDFGFGTEAIFDIRIVLAPHGPPTIWDKDLLIYVFSILDHRIDNGLEVDNDIIVPVHAFLKAVRRSTGSRGYTLLHDAIRRLRSTIVAVTTHSTGQVHTYNFSWIENIGLTSVDRGRLALQIRLPDNLFRAVTEYRSVTSIHSDYFTLKGGLERRLYELALKMTSAFNLSEWTVDIKNLARYCGANDTIRRFKMRLRNIIDEDRLPDFRIDLTPDLKSSTFRNGPDVRSRTADRTKVYIVHK